MADSSVLEDKSLLSAADRGFYALESRLNLASGAVIFALVLLSATNVIGRKLFNAPLPGFIDWVEQSMAVFAFVGLAFCQRDGGHIRMDLAVRRLSGRRLWLTELVSMLLMLFVTAMLIWGSWFHFLRSFDFAAPLWSRDSSIDIGLPLWPAKLIVPAALALLWVRLALQCWGYGRALLSGASKPVAIPLPQTAAEQAASESGLVETAPNG